ncbi:hypothetical protein BDV93DRAFT_545197 [Ceratobasidium sp. AG-I]|nr:hypothetical protein BDV93DRAFT_545197 [Ceratobasidium sp. AG-I]
MNNYREWTDDPTLILGVDIGTTYSGVTFLYLTEGVKPSDKIQRVMEWPGQRGKAEAKVPTLVWYDQNRNAVKLGAEAYKLKGPKAQSDRLKLAKHFKYHLHPSTLSAKHKLDKHPLPYGVSLEQVYADFMKYLLESTQTFFEKKVLGGRSIWGRLAPTMFIVLAHPNGWGTPEQGLLRRAARRAGMAASDNQISFVTEAEASVHFCMSRPALNLTSSIETLDKIIVCDAGGSTVDTTLYKVTRKSPLQLEEVIASACIQAGGIFVDKNARSYLEEQFAQVDSLPSAQQVRYVDDGIDDFIFNAKNHFDDTEDEVIIKVGSLKDDFSEIDVDSGDMIIASYAVAGFFDPCVDQIRESLHNQIGDHDVPVRLTQYCFIGGFGDSPYLFNRLNNEFGSSLVTLNDRSAKAVADGSVVWRIEQSVVSRVLGFSYGIKVAPPYNPILPQHLGRIKSMSCSGMLCVSGAWSKIVKRGTSMACGEVKRKTYRAEFGTNYPPIMNYRTKIYSTKTANRLDFVLDNRGSINPGFQEVCELSADLTALRGVLQEEEGIFGSYWLLKFVIGIRFGGTELEAFIEWEEEGYTRTGPVSIIAARLQ